MELENIVANTVLLKAREGKATKRAVRCEEHGVHGLRARRGALAARPPRAARSGPGTRCRHQPFRHGVLLLRTCPGELGPRKGRGSGRRPRDGGRMTGEGRREEGRGKGRP